MKIVLQELSDIHDQRTSDLERLGDLESALRESQQQRDLHKNEVQLIK